MDQYGGELFGATKTLRSMFLNIVPKELKSEIMKHDKLNNADHVELMRWARKRSLVLQQENLAMITKRNLTAQMSKLGSVSRLLFRRSPASTRSFRRPERCSTLGQALDRCDRPTSIFFSCSSTSS